VRAAGTDVLALVEFGFRSGRYGYPPLPGVVGWFCLFSMVYEGIIPRYVADSARIRWFPLFSILYGRVLSRAQGAGHSAQKMKNARASGRFFDFFPIAILAGKKVIVGQIGF
jgi:hypothetical protein